MRVSSFDTVWNALVGYAVQQNCVYTLVRGSRNEISYNVEENAIVVDHDEQHSITRKQFERVWDTFKQDRFLR